MRKHHKDCTVWQEQAGVCPTCLRRRYRHKPDCPGSEESERRRLLQKHDMDPDKFEAFLRVLSRHYRKLARVRLH